MAYALHVPAYVIKVLRLFTAKDATRPALNCIHIEIGSEESKLIASDGVMLVAYRHVEKVPGLGEVLEVNARHHLFNGIDYSPDQSLVTIGVQNGADIFVKTPRVNRVFKESNGTSETAPYPDYRKVFPKEVSGEAFQFDVRYGSRITSAMEIIHPDNKTRPYTAFGPNGDLPTVIDFKHPLFTGVISPIRIKEPPSGAPAWALEPVSIVVDDTNVDDLV